MWRLVSLTPTTVPELQLDCRLLLFTEEEGGAGGGWWDGWLLALDHRLCAYKPQSKTGRARQLHICPATWTCAAPFMLSPAHKSLHLTTWEEGQMCKMETSTAMKMQFVHNISKNTILTVLQAWVKQWGQATTWWSWFSFLQSPPPLLIILILFFYIHWVVWESQFAHTTDLNNVLIHFSDQMQDVGRCFVICRLLLYYN